MTSFRFGANRRGFLLGGGALALGSLSSGAFAQGAGTPPDSPPVKVALDVLMADQALPDIWMGDANAPITMIEYSSLTCSHCAEFYIKSFPLLKANYIDKGKVRFTQREFPLDPLAAGASMLARCSGDKRDAMIDLFFKQQPNWAFVKNPVEALLGLVKQTGMSEAAFEACLNDQKLFEKVDAERALAAKKLGVNSTPTFFINGDKHPGEIPPDQIDATLAPFLK